MNPWMITLLLSLWAALGSIGMRAYCRSSYALHWIAEIVFTSLMGPLVWVLCFWLLLMQAIENLAEHQRRGAERKKVEEFEEKTRYGRVRVMSYNPDGDDA